MGLISSLAAPSAPQFQSLTIKPVARVTATLMTPRPETSAADASLRRKGGAEPPPELAAHPILSPNASDAVFKGLLPMQPAMAQAASATEGEPDQIELLTEVDGISLDGIPYLRDGAVLLDDLPQAEPEPAPKAKPAAADVMALPSPAPLRPELAGQAEPEALRANQAERAYLEEREISAIRAESVAPTDPQATPPEAGATLAVDQPDATAAPSVDKRA